MNVVEDNKQEDENEGEDEDSQETQSCADQFQRAAHSMLVSHQMQVFAFTRLKIVWIWKEKLHRFRRQYSNHLIFQLLLSMGIIQQAVGILCFDLVMCSTTTIGVNIFR